MTAKKTAASLVGVAKIALAAGAAKRNEAGLGKPAERKEAEGSKRVAEARRKPAQAGRQPVKAGATTAVDAKRAATTAPAGKQAPEPAKAAARPLEPTKAAARPRKASGDKKTAEPARKAPAAAAKFGEAEARGIKTTSDSRGGVKPVDGNKKTADMKRTIEQAGPAGMKKAAEPVRQPSPTPKKAPEAPVAARKPADPASKADAAKKGSQRQGFKTSEYIVYPAHGVGQIVAIEEQEVAGYKLELFVISFAKDKMTLRVPTVKVASVGMRKLAEPGLVTKALETLKGRARVKRTMWSRRAQEYEAKINSGDIVAISEVVRDLYRSESQPEQSYSERQLYEAALDRLSREIAAVERLTETEAVKQVEAALAKGPRRGPKAADEGEDAADDADEAEAA